MSSPLSSGNKEAEDWSPGTDYGLDTGCWEGGQQGINEKQVVEQSNRRDLNTTRGRMCMDTCESLQPTTEHLPLRIAIVKCVKAPPPPGGAGGGVWGEGSLAVSTESAAPATQSRMKGKGKGKGKGKRTSTNTNTSTGISL
ncbi:hypothetical protein ATANTOWER_015855 [Ataeniobius toweri]|uniref:Uncharacterized protein n=1 Tax=Ataeniobius toweri TaxID=208326 RepID=A0ABU7AFL4_9TELE|nr:hypothetical protein [Ataeniobius toweri]